MEREEATAKVRAKPKNRKKKIGQKDEDLSEEDLALKEELEFHVEKVQDSDPALQKVALQSMRHEIRTSTSSMTSVPKLLKFLRPHYRTLKAYYETMADSELKTYLADILSVLAPTPSAEGERGSLKFRLVGSEEDIGSWGHAYVRNLTGEVAQEYKKRQNEDAPVSDLMELVQKIVAFYMKHNVETEAVDLLMEHKDIIPKVLKNEEDGDTDEDLEKKIAETTQETKAALEKIVTVRLSAAQPKNVPKQSSDSKYIKYKPSQQSTAFNSGAKERIIRMVEMPVDPLEPPKFKHKRVPKASGSPLVPVMHSPPRPVTVKDQQDWKIPPCISNWKNPKGYTIPLDKRLAADGRGLQDVQISDNFAKLSEALYVAEQKAREAVAMRSKVQKEMMMKEKERKEQELRALAQKARSERTGAAPPPSVSIPSERNEMDDDEMRGDYECPREREREKVRDMDGPKETREEREERLRREKIREERRRERERERRLEAKDAAMGKKSKITRDRGRDISEKVALGMASTGAGRGGEVMYDHRLFNQEKGLESGFATDDQYNVYDKGLFTTQSTLSGLYRPKKDADTDVYGGADEQLDKIMKTERFKPDKAFAGTSEKAGPRDRPVEFEKDAEEADPFGLDQFLTEVKKGKKAMDKVGSGGTMRASAGSSMRDGNDGGSGRTRIGFERGR